jgi:acylphosphatase
MIDSSHRLIRHVSIRGRVQGVGYRAWTEREALARRLDGFVRNRRDGTVEALFAGPAEVVMDMIAACHRGPFGAHVDEVVEQLAAESGRALTEGFSVLPTA